MSTQVLVPNLPESVADATLITWHKNVGDHIQQDDNLVDLETDKVVLEVPAPHAGILRNILIEGGTTVTAGQVLAEIERQAVEPDAVAAAPIPEAASDIPLSPAVRRLLQEHPTLDPAQISATGKQGRLTKEDVLNAVTQSHTPKSTPAPTREVKQAPVSAAATLNGQNRPEQRVPMTRLRTRIAERLVQAQQSAAMLTTFNEINMKPVMDLRTRYKDAFLKQHSTKLGFMSFFVKACTEALKKFPIVNASIDGQDILYHGFFDIGIAVSSPRGLVVPVLRNTEDLSFSEIEQSIVDYATDAQAGRLSYENLTGGTFTITNGGTFGSMLSTPILNPPQSAILGMHNIVQRPVVEDGEIVIRPIMYVALSYDHRIIDGREAVQFLVMIKQSLEDPARILLQV